MSVRCPVPVPGVGVCRTRSRRRQPAEVNEKGAIAAAAALPAPPARFSDGSTRCSPGWTEDPLRLTAALDAARTRLDTADACAMMPR